MSAKKENSVLKRLFLDKVIKIRATDGKKTIARSQKAFKAYLDPDFKNWYLDNQQKKTTVTTVEMYEVVDDASFKNMFTSLSKDLDKLCLTQGQIVSFCKNHKNFLCTDLGTLFLFKENEKYFIAYVYIFNDGLRVYVYFLDYQHIWTVGLARHIVVPIIS